MAAFRTPPISAVFRYRLTTPAKAVCGELEDRGDGPVAPEPPVPGPSESSEPSLGRPDVELDVLRTAHAERLAVRALVALVLRGRVPSVFDRDGVDLPSAPAAGQGMDPLLPVLALLEARV